jgi:hypothetical protein
MLAERDGFAKPCASTICAIFMRYEWPCGSLAGAADAGYAAGWDIAGGAVGRTAAIGGRSDADQVARGGAGGGAVEESSAAFLAEYSSLVSRPAFRARSSAVSCAERDSMAGFLAVYSSFRENSSPVGALERRFLRIAPGTGRGGERQQQSGHRIRTADHSIHNTTEGSPAVGGGQYITTAQAGGDQRMSRGKLSGRVWTLMNTARRSVFIPGYSCF